VRQKKMINLRVHWCIRCPSWGLSPSMGLGLIVCPDLQKQPKLNLINFE